MQIASQTSRSKLIVIDIIAHFLLASAIGLAISIALAGAVLLLSSTAQAQGVAPVQPSAAGQGTLLFRSRVKGDTVSIPQVATEVEIEVSGIVARARVKQVFRNPFDEWYEGTYVFPLPENAAVDHLRMTIGSRVIEGVVKEREAARADYDKARSNGQRAALLDQERPNIFTSSVANIGPREQVTVEIQYQQTLRYDQGRFSLRFPMVVGPRYLPGDVQLAQASASVADSDRPDGSWGSGRASRAVSDASRITPPVLGPGLDPINPVSIRVLLDAGVPIASLESPYHRVNVRELDSQRREVKLTGTPANRDFELAWTPAPDRAPRVAHFREARGDKHYHLLMLLPPMATSAAERLSREVVFIIDTSGSMHGASIAQAREALLLALARLGARDSFNVIEFNSVTRALWPNARPVSAENLGSAADFVRSLKAQGGTEMAPALKLALNGGDSAGRLRQVVFLTDGAVGNEDELFSLIRSRLGDSRLFTIGIGSAPNSHFMTRAATEGRGTFTYIGKADEVREKMSALFAKLESPLVKGLRIEFPNEARAEFWPNRVPDLYAGEPLVIAAETASSAGPVKISGLRGEERWETTLDLGGGERGSGLGVLWAREKIRSLLDSAHEGSAAEEVRAKVVDVALAHHIASKYTSLVAVEQMPARPADAPLLSAAIPTNLPEGWSHEAVFGELPQGATSAPLNFLMGFIALLLALLAWYAPRRPVLAPRSRL